ncbi:MAG: hypothetical protein ACOCWG_02335 [bacterium]
MSILRENILKTDAQLEELTLKFDRTFKKVFNSIDDVKSYLNIESFYASDLPSINLAKCIFNFDLELLSVKFSKNITFSESVFVGKVDFIASEFNADFLQDNNERTMPNNFFNVIFLEYSNFEAVKFTNGVCFRCSNFKKWVNLTDTYFGGDTDMRYCSFSEEVIFSYLGRFSSYPENYPIKIKLDESTFYKKALFYNRIFNNCSFSNTKFQALSDFYNTKFNEDVCFDKTDFLGTSVFAEVTFCKKAIFLYTQVSRNMILRRTNFLGGVNLALINFIGEGYINSLEVNITDFHTDGNISDNSYDELSETINIRHKRETYRILKHEALKQNNRIEALTYHALEMKSYEEELKQIDKTKRNCFFSVILSPWFFILFVIRLFTFDLDKEKKSNYLSNDKLILWFNKFTNNFGSNWIQSISFTFWIAIFWYVLFLIFVNIDTQLYWDCDNWGETIKYAFQFLNITEWNYKPYNADYHWAYIPLLVGRIFVSLGIYQTIQAFRKYGRF